jgi:peptidoglycan/xylan/chitin deacetylase (PgdA/CDA1 family)
MQIRRQSNRMLKLAISLVVYCADCVGLVLRRLTGARRGASFVILYYHSVSAEQRGLFGGQLDRLLRCAIPVGAGEKPGSDEGKRYAAVTFDDAFESLIENALPELRSRGIPCTIFVVSETLGGAANWEDIGETHGNEKIMTLAQARDAASELVTFGAHSMTHPVLTAVDEPTARKEIFGSRSRLEQFLGREIRFFSFPYGAHNPHLVGLCREAGYERVFTTVPGPVRNGELAAGRTPVAPTDWTLEFHLKLAGAYRWVGFASGLKSRLKHSSTAQPIAAQPPPAALR